MFLECTADVFFGVFAYAAVEVGGNHRILAGFDWLVNRIEVGARRAGDSAQLVDEPLSPQNRVLALVIADKDCNFAALSARQTVPAT